MEQWPTLALRLQMCYQIVWERKGGDENQTQGDTGTDGG